MTEYTLSLHRVLDIKQRRYFAADLAAIVHGQRAAVRALQKDLERVAFARLASANAHMHKAAAMRRRDGFDDVGEPAFGVLQRGSSVFHIARATKKAGFLRAHPIKYILSG